MISYSLLFSSFKCEGCHKAAGSSRKENRFTAKRLQTTRLGNYIETRVNNFLRKKEADAGDVHIRVVFSGDKQVEVKPGMKHRLEKSHFKCNTDFFKHKQYIVVSNGFQDAQIFGLLFCGTFCRRQRWSGRELTQPFSAAAAAPSQAASALLEPFPPPANNDHFKTLVSPTHRAIKKKPPTIV